MQPSEEEIESDGGKKYKKGERDEEAESRRLRDGKMQVKKDDGIIKLETVHGFVYKNKDHIERGSFTQTHTLRNRCSKLKAMLCRLYLV